MYQNQRFFVSGAGAALVRLVVVAVSLGVGTESRDGSTSVASCRHQLVFDVYAGYACDVIVTSKSSKDGGAGAAEVAVVGGRVPPSNATALRLTLRRDDDAVKTGRRTTTTHALTRLEQLRSLEVDVSETPSFSAVALLSRLGAASLRRLSLFRSASTTEDLDFRLRLPTSADGTFAASSASLSTLVLSDLGIDKLPANTFAGLTSMCFLFVNNNRLGSLPVGLFDDLCRLSSLSLAGNRFVDVKNLSLRTAVSGGSRCGHGLGRLRTLDLHCNRLRRLRAGALRALSGVVELNLSENQISVLDADAFSGLAELRTLYLDANQLTSVAPAMFRGLTALTTLDLSRNRLSVVASGTFRDLAALRSLHLQRNELENVTAAAWTGLNQLIVLNLTSNRLRAVFQSTFAGLCGLRQLDLSDNALTLAGAEAFVCLPALQQLGLTGNPLPDATGRRQQRHWWSRDAVGGLTIAACDSCNSTSPTTTAEVNCAYSTGAVHPCDFKVTSTLPSSSGAARLSADRVLAVPLAVSAVVAAVLLSVSAVLYACLLRRRRRAVMDCSHQRLATSITLCSPSQTGTGINNCTVLDTSVHGIYVKFNT